MLSTTLKAVVLDNDDNIVFKSYERHYPRIAEKTVELLKGFMEELNIDNCTYDLFLVQLAWGLAECAKIPFVQEVYATRVAMEVIPSSRI